MVDDPNVADARERARTARAVGGMLSLEPIDFRIAASGFLDRVMPGPSLLACAAAVYVAPNRGWALAFAVTFCALQLTTSAVMSKSGRTDDRAAALMSGVRVAAALVFVPLLVAVSGSSGWMVAIGPISILPIYARRAGRVWMAGALLGLTLLALVYTGASMEQLLLAGVALASAGFTAGGLIAQLRSTTENAAALARDLEAARSSSESRGEALERALAEAERAVEAKSRFLATVSHEIRTPMNGVLGTADVLGDTELSAKQHELVAQLRASGRVLMTVLDDVLDMQRVAAGKVSIERAPFSVPVMMRALEGRFASSAAAKGLRLSVDLRGSVDAALLGDAVRLEQVIGNFVGNAIKFTHRGVVTIRATMGFDGDDAPEEGQLVRFRVDVVDEGIGVPTERLSAIFEPFEQADGSTTRLYGGTGLGLAICRELAAAMGGAVGARSVEGEGSTFWLEVDLPAAGYTISSVMPTAPVGGDPAANDLAGTVVAVAEDNEINRRVVQRFLERLGCECYLAEDGERLLALLDEISPDVVLMDLHMPILDGLGATEVILERQAGGTYPPFPVVGLTASALPEDRERCLAAGMAGYLTKPLVRERLETALREVRAHDRVTMPSRAA